MFGGTPGTVHLTKEGVEFVYFNNGSKAFERVKISPAHAHMVIPMERKALVPSQRLAPQLIRNACTDHSTTANNTTATCHNPC
jgi:hypothetical protein